MVKRSVLEKREEGVVMRVYGLVALTVGAMSPVGNSMYFPCA